MIKSERDRRIRRVARRSVNLGYIPMKGEYALRAEYRKALNSVNLEKESDCGSESQYSDEMIDNNISVIASEKAKQIIADFVKRMGSRRRQTYVEVLIYSCYIDITLWDGRETGRIVDVCSFRSLPFGTEYATQNNFSDIKYHRSGIIELALATLFELMRFESLHVTKLRFSLAIDFGSRCRSRNCDIDELVDDFMKSFLSSQNMIGAFQGEMQIALNTWAATLYEEMKILLNHTQIWEEEKKIY